MMRRLRTALPLVVLAAFAVHVPPCAAAAHPRSVILMIPDGCGPQTLTLAGMVAGHPLALDSMLVGAVTTGSSDARVTDSAASATAYATGHKTYNGGISEDTLHRALGTLLEAAEARGLATGLVATSRITHATPAAFAAHVDQRASEDAIAEQMLAHDIEVLLGGGRSHFVPLAAGGLREDGRDLVAAARARGVHVVVDREGLAHAGAGPLLGLFATDHMDFAINADSTAQPSLKEMTQVALARLAPAPRGFFVMIEGSRIDHAAHDNDVAAAVREVLEYDEAVRVALDFARHDGHTLVLSVADHETGGLTLGRRIGDESLDDLRPEVVARVRKSADWLAHRMRAGEDPAALMREYAGVDSLGTDEREWLAGGSAERRWLEWGIGEVVSRRARVGWATNSHTAAEVGLYAFGPGRERFIGRHDNTEIARGIAALLGLDLDAVTARLRAAAPAAGALRRR